MSMDLFVLAGGGLSNDEARDAVVAMCGRLPGLSFSAWEGRELGGVVSFWGARLVSVRRTDDISEELPAPLAREKPRRALVVSGKPPAWEFVVFVAEHLASALNAVLFDPQGGEERQADGAYELEDLRALLDELQGDNGR